EGTRNKNPKKLLPFKMGPKLLAEKLNLKIQPLVLLNVRDVLQFNPFRMNRNRVVVIVLPPINPEKGTDWYKKLEKDMQKEIDKYYQ
ncbi:MAG: 1-acyl-sn-glycerol-3-phosphate acyltransferase, partial [Nautilia sp.]